MKSLKESKILSVLLALTLALSACTNDKNEVPGDNGAIQASAQLSIPQGNTSNTLTPYMFVGGTAVVNFEYKVTTSVASCASGSGYSSAQPAWTSVQIDVSGIPDGPAVLCVIGIDASGNAQSFASAGTYQWTKIPNPSVSVSSLTGTQGQTVTFIISQSSISDFETQVDVFTQDQSNDPTLTAQSGVDFTAKFGTVIIPPGSTVTTFTVATTAEVGSGTKTFQVLLSNPFNATLSTSIGVATLTGISGGGGPSNVACTTSDYLLNNVNSVFSLTLVGNENGSSVSACLIGTCQAGYNLSVDHRTCIPSTVACTTADYALNNVTLTNSTVVTGNENGPDVSACLITSCASGYTVAADQKSCAVTVVNSPPAALVIETSAGSEPHLIDGSNRAIYIYTSDTSGVSNCTGSCATIWPPVTLATGQSVTASGRIASQSSLSTIVRGDGTTQVTYNGRPLYYFISDAPGQATGNGVGGFLLSSP